MAMKGDFLGFYFDKIHSSELGIMRVSDGSRYTDNLLPAMQDKTTQVPGGDGTYYFGSFYTQKQFNFPIAFDNVSEQQLRQMRALFGDKKVHTLIFDEFPYKVYKVKAVGTPNLKYVCFERESEHDSRVNDIDDTIRDKEGLYYPGARIMKDRIYKGEGTLTFTAYQPFARSRYKYLDEYTMTNIPEWGPMNSAAATDVYFNYYEWAESSRLVLSTQQKKLNDVPYVVDRPVRAGTMFYNPGDLPAPYKLKLFTGPNFQGGTIGYVDGDHLTFEAFALYSGDAGFQLNSKLNLVEGINSDGEVTGTIYNRYIIAGDFAPLPPTEDLTWMPFYLTGDSSIDIKIEYDYLFL